jgi:hypothetical protein
MEPTEGSETSAFKIQTPGKYPEEYLPQTYTPFYKIPTKYTIKNRFIKGPTCFFTFTCLSPDDDSPTKLVGFLMTTFLIFL